MSEKPQELHGISWGKWLSSFPQLDDLAAARPTYWGNIHSMPASSAITSSGFTGQDVEDAALRLERFAPLIARLFPETSGTNGLIESPLRKIDKFKEQVHQRYELPQTNSLLLKMDSHLPISGSIKARGGIYEVLKVAEDIAMNAQVLKWSDDYARLMEPEMRELFGNYSFAVGSTGNLGLSIGIMGRALGFKVRVHMSRDARQWKKDLLREKGAEVIEHEGDYEAAVKKGREEADKAPYCHFVDDENSRTLFIGYATAAQRLKKQLDAMGVQVNDQNPLHVYLPCGVGGGPGGICFGLKLAMHDSARCSFVEPVQAPAVTLGLGTGLYGNTSVHEIGLSGETAADGLAVHRASTLVCKAMADLLDSCITVDDDELYRLLAIMHDTEGIDLEPSALAGAAGYIGTMKLGELGVLSRGTHVIWATGGSMVPEEEWQSYYEHGKSML